MADRKRGASLRIIADLTPGIVTATVTITDPTGASLGTATGSEIAGSGRVIASLAAPASQIDGLYTAVWNDASATTQYFTVDASQAQVTRWDLLGLAGNRYQLGHRGVVTSCTGVYLNDTTLFGGADDHVGKWLLPPAASSSVGLYRRVLDYNGATLTLDQTFLADLAAGDRYHLINCNPQELIDELAGQIHSLQELTFIPLQANGLAVSANGVVAIPAGWDYVHEVQILLASDPYPTHIRSDAWHMVTGRKLVVPGDATYTCNLRGSRKARVPLWDDSYIDVDANALSAVLAAHVMAYRGGGPATDPDSYQSRSAFDLNEGITTLHDRLPRPPHNTTDVME